MAHIHQRINLQDALSALHILAFDEQDQPETRVRPQGSSRGRLSGSGAELSDGRTGRGDEEPAPHEQKEQYLEAEYEFHKCIARAAGNPLLLEIIGMVSGLLRGTRTELVNFVPDRCQDLREHYLSCRSQP
jgi:DNA-binding FadR family transcriptional regulator